VGKDKGTIQIDIQYSGNQLRFSTKNPIERRENPLSNGQGGIGIINVEKRLNLLYPGKYHLKFSEVGNLFNVDMQIYIDQTT
jgi:LytS/YehU family sensor histidine kinase